MNEKPSETPAPALEATFIRNERGEGRLLLWLREDGRPGGKLARIQAGEDREEGPKEAQKRVSKELGLEAGDETWKEVRIEARDRGLEKVEKEGRNGIRAEVRDELRDELRGGEEPGEGREEGRGEDPDEDRKEVRRELLLELRSLRKEAQEEALKKEASEEQNTPASTRPFSEMVALSDALSPIAGEIHTCLLHLSSEAEPRKVRGVLVRPAELAALLRSENCPFPEAALPSCSPSAKADSAVKAAAPISASLRAWLDILHFALHQVALGRIRPSFPNVKGHPEASWRATLGIADRRLLVSLARHLPPAAFGEAAALQTQAITSHAEAEADLSTRKMFNPPLRKEKYGSNDPFQTRLHHRSRPENNVVPDSAEFIRKSEAEGRWACVLELVNQLIDSLVRGPEFDTSEFDASALAPSNLDGSALDPSVLDPSALVPSDLDPSALDPFELGPSDLEPSALDPLDLGPSDLEPTAFDPSALDPSALDSSALDPSELDTSEHDPSALNPSELEASGALSPLFSPASRLKSASVASRSPTFQASTRADAPVGPLLVSTRRSGSDSRSVKKENRRLPHRNSPEDVLEAALQDSSAEGLARLLSPKEQRELLQWEDRQLRASQPLISLGLRLVPPPEGEDYFALEYFFLAHSPRETQKSVQSRENEEKTGFRNSWETRSSSPSTPMRASPSGRADAETAPAAEMSSTHSAAAPLFPDEDDASSPSHFSKLEATNSGGEELDSPPVLARRAQQKGPQKVGLGNTGKAEIGDCANEGGGKGREGRVGAEDECDGQAPVNSEEKACQWWVPAKSVWHRRLEMALLGDDWEAIAVRAKQMLEKLGRMLAPVEMSLADALPERALLGKGEVWDLLSSGHRQLAENGIELQVATELRDLSVRFPRARVRLVRADGLPPELSVLANRYRVIWEVLSADLRLNSQTLHSLGQQAPLARHQGRWIPMTAEAAKRLARVSERQEIEWTGPQALGAALAGEVRQSGDLADAELVGEVGLQNLLLQLKRPPSQVPVPDNLEATLRSYQKKGLSWLVHRAGLGLGTILADDMGLGKTIQIIALLLHFQKHDPNAGPSLVVCPASLVGNWERELSRFAPTLRQVRHHGDERAKSSEELREKTGAHDVVITTYGLLRRDENLLSKIHFGTVVLDEAQNIKNPVSAQAKAARSLQGTRRIVLSGTPVENRLSELWSLSDFANPGLLGPLARFRREIANPIEKERDARAHRRLHSAIAPFVLRRMKNDPAIVPELPEKEEFRVVCALTAEQARLYQKAVEHSLDAVDELEGLQRSGKVLRLLTELKQICNHPAQYLKENQLASDLQNGESAENREREENRKREEREERAQGAQRDQSNQQSLEAEILPESPCDSQVSLFSKIAAQPESNATSSLAEPPALEVEKVEFERLAGRSGKLERCTEILEEIVASGEKALVFTQYVDMGRRLCSYLGQRLGSPVPLFHGGLSLQERERLVDEFQQESGGPSVMVLSLRAGGVGLNLTRASHVIHYDRWWNPAVENQATDRAYRIGQQRRVQVHYLLTMGTLEERIDRLLEEKRALADSVISGGEAWLSQLSTDQLRALISLGSDAAIESLDLDVEEAS